MEYNSLANFKNWQEPPFNSDKQGAAEFFVLEFAIDNEAKIEDEKLRQFIAILHVYLCLVLCCSGPL